MREPKRLQRRPHFKGMPVPANVIIGKDGVPDFAQVDMFLAGRLRAKRACFLCGEKITGDVAFVGGEMSIQVGLFYDGPMHLECARYSFTACPFVRGDHRKYRENVKDHGPDWVHTELPVAPVKRMGILTCEDYNYIANAFAAVGRKREIWEEELAS